MAGTNITWMNNVTGPGDYMDSTIRMTNGAYILGVMLAGGLIMVLAMRSAGREMDEILLVVGALEFFIALYSILAGYLGFQYFILPIAMMLAGIVLNRMGG